MRQSLADFIDKCFSVKVHLEVGSYELHDYQDGAYADFRTNKVQQLTKLAIITQGYDSRLYAQDGQIVIRLFENFSD